MTEPYRMIYEEGSGYYEEKKSRFLAEAFPVKDEADFSLRLAAVRKKYYDARHHCYAYALGTKQEMCRFSDDGEPGGTAGKPILDVLKGAEVCGAGIIVTRYFGGTLLGTGGLVRAYTAAARDALEHAVIITAEEGERWLLTCDYSAFGQMERLAAEKGYLKENALFGSDVTIPFILRAGEADALYSAAAELTGGAVLTERAGTVRFAEIGGKIVYL